MGSRHPGPPHTQDAPGRLPVAHPGCQTLQREPGIRVLRATRSCPRFGCSVIFSRLAPGAGSSGTPPESAARGRGRRCGHAAEHLDAYPFRPPSPVPRAHRGSQGTSGRDSLPRLSIRFGSRERGEVGLNQQYHGLKLPGRRQLAEQCRGGARRPALEGAFEPVNLEERFGLGRTFGPGHRGELSGGDPAASILLKDELPRTGS